MALDPSAVAGLAARLQGARDGGRQTASLALAYPEMDLADAYAVQHAWAEGRRAAGERLVGYKVGFTMPAIQRACGVSEPAYGHLFEAALVEEGGTLPAGLFEPRVETELAFILKRPLEGPNPTREEALDAIEAVVPAIEVVDFRVRLKDEATGAARTTADAIADNVNNAAVVLGRQRFAAEALDLRRQSAILYRHGVAEASGVAGMVLEDPINSLVWLADALHRRGKRLDAGQLVMTGSFIIPLPADAGDYSADFGPLGTVSLRFP